MGRRYHPQMVSGNVTTFANVDEDVPVASHALGYNSGYGSRGRCMWNDGQYLLFRFVLYTLKHKKYLFLLILIIDQPGFPVRV